MALMNFAYAFEKYSDPLRPPVKDESSIDSKIPFYNIPARLKRIEEQVESEAKALNALSPLQPSVQFDAFGYHSDYVPIVNRTPDKPLWILDFDANIITDSNTGIVLVPAFDQRSPEPKGYAFPKRFRISLVDKNEEHLKTYVDWTSEDFPDPNRRPVTFTFSDVHVEAERRLNARLRLEVFAGHEENGFEYFSLARVYLIRKSELRNPRNISASSSFESPPYWSDQYLASPRYTLGMPLSEQNGTDGDLILKLPASRLKDPLVIRVELDEQRKLGWINLFPGNSPSGMDVPGYGFPETTHIHLLVKRGGGDSLQRFPLINSGRLKNPRSNMLRVAAFGKRAVALEIVCNDFPVYQGQAVCSFGEIEIFKAGENLSLGRPVTLQAGVLDDVPDLGRLVDGRASGRDVLPLDEWMQQLAAGKPHVAQLSLLNAEYVHLSERWHLLRVYFLSGLGALLLLVGLAFILILLRSRRQATMNIRRQINADLHDDIGSKIAAISLAARDVEELASEENLSQRGRWIGTVVNSMHHALRDVLWLTSAQTDTFSLLVQKLAETARQIVPEQQLVLRICDVNMLPNRSIHLQTKRDILFFAKEALHNAISHAEANKVIVNIQFVKPNLCLNISDDGQGFDLALGHQLEPNQVHMGLQTMRERAKRMKALLDIRSKIGEGTHVELKVKL